MSPVLWPSTAEARLICASAGTLIGVRPGQNCPGQVVGGHFPNDFYPLQLIRLARVINSETCGIQYSTAPTIGRALIRTFTTSAAVCEAGYKQSKIVPSAHRQSHCGNPPGLQAHRAIPTNRLSDWIVKSKPAPIVSVLPSPPLCPSRRRFGFQFASGLTPHAAPLGTMLVFGLPDPDATTLSP